MAPVGADVKGLCSTLSPHANIGDGGSRDKAAPKESTSSLGILQQFAMPFARLVKIVSLYHYCPVKLTLPLHNSLYEKQNCRF